MSVLHPDSGDCHLDIAYQNGHAWIIYALEKPNEAWRHARRDPNNCGFMQATSPKK
jgi:hypothetical protein